MARVYETNDWRALNKIDRAQLLLVVEGVKPGTIIGGNHTSLVRVLDRLGLSYQADSQPCELFPTLTIASRNVLMNYNIKRITRSDADLEAIHHITGDFLGYPKCCIDEYTSFPTLEQFQAIHSGLIHLSYRFGQELTAMIERNGKYPNIFDYRPPTFTPCSINCRNARRLLEDWKNVLLDFDREAANSLMLFNRQRYPEKMVHQE